jgi:hypothetical protein
VACQAHCEELCNSGGTGAAINGRDAEGVAKIPQRTELRTQLVSEVKYAVAGDKYTTGQKRKDVCIST